MRDAIVSCQSQRHLYEASNLSALIGRNCLTFGSHSVGPGKRNTAAAVVPIEKECSVYFQVVMSPVAIYNQKYIYIYIYI